MADMENFKKFWESITGRPYGSPPPPQKKKKTAVDWRGGNEPESKEICTEKV